MHCLLVSARHGAVIESFKQYRALGLKLGLGTDTWPPDMVENMQLGLILCRVVEQDAEACRANDYHDAATLGGAQALGRDDLGRLAPGAKADITVFDLGHDRAGQVIDPIQTMMIDGSGRDFDTVIVDGRFVMREKRLPGVDLAALHAQAQFESLVEKYPERTVGYPPVREIFSSSYPRAGRS